MSDRNFIITGKTNTAHISSADDGALYGSLFGEEDYVLTTLNENPLPISFVGQTVTVGAGDFVMQGRYGRIVEPDSITIETPSAGTARYSDVVIQYLKNVAEDVEQMQLVVVNGQPKSDAGDPPEPILTKGNIFNGETQREIRVARVLADTRGGTTTFTLVSDENEFTPLDKVYITVDDHFDVKSTNPIQNKKVAEFKNEIEKNVENAKEEIKKDIIVLENVVVRRSYWRPDPTIPEYPNRADIPIEGCTKDHRPNITFGSGAIQSYNYYPYEETHDGYISIWGKIALDQITIESIELVREVNYDRT